MKKLFSELGVEELQRRMAPTPPNTFQISIYWFDWFIDLFLVAVTSMNVWTRTYRSNRLVIKSETFTESWGEAFGNMAADNTQWHEREQKWNCLRSRFEGEHKGVGINRHDYASQHNKQGITLSWLWCYCWKQPVPECHILYVSKLHQPPLHHCWEGKKESNTRLGTGNESTGHILGFLLSQICVVFLSWCISQLSPSKKFSVMDFRVPTLHLNTWPQHTTHCLLRLMDSVLVQGDFKEKRYHAHTHTQRTHWTHCVMCVSRWASILTSTSQN